MNFTQLTTDYARPGAGINEWSYGQYVVNVGFPALDMYYRFRWLDFQPANGSHGVYDFTAFDQQIQAAIDAGQKFSFGIMQQCGGCDSNLQTHIVDPVTGQSASLIYPTYVHNLMQGETPKDWSTGGEWFPNYNSPNWLAEWKALNVAVNNHIMTTTYKGVRYQDVIFEIDVRGYGDFGEWTNNEFGGPAGTTATVASLQAIIDATVQSYSNFQCVAMQATFDGNQLGNTMNPPAIGYYALTTTNAKGKLGWRRDSWGITDPYNNQWTNTNPTTYNGLVFKTAIMNVYKYAPIVGEPEEGEGFSSLAAQMSQFNVNSFGNGNVPGTGTSADTINGFKAATKVAGYRYSLTGGSVSGSSVTLNWSNVGVAPTYENWTVTFQLRQSTTVKWTGNSSLVLKTFLPGTQNTVDTFDWSTLSGTYDLYLIITDPTGVRKPMPLNISGQNADGSYTLQTGLVLTGGTPPPPPPPPPPPTTTAANIFTTQAPTGALLNDGQALELGVKFRTTVAGYITGVRFYKQSGNTGTHIGELYSSTGTRLAQATFTNESATGWQTVIFATPVAVTANTTYVAAYFSPNGFYSDTNRGLASAITNSNLTALANGTDGVNGVYKYSATPAFPTSSFALPNYWVDVVFSLTNTVNPPPPNQPPVARITGATSVTLTPGSITLSGATSTDSDGTIVGYLWTKQSGPSGDTISTPTASSTLISGLQPGTYVYALQVTDNLGAVGSVTYSFTVHF